MDDLKPNQNPRSLTGPSPKPKGCFGLCTFPRCTEEEASGKIERLKLGPFFQGPLSLGRGLELGLRHMLGCPEEALGSV